MKKLTEILLALSFLFIVACNHKKSYETVTRIFPDGSCYREFSGVGDSLFMVGKMLGSNLFPIIIDSTWKISWTYSAPTCNRIYSDKWPLKQWNWDKDTSKHLSLDVIALKMYPNVEAMAKTFRFNHSNWDSIVPKAKLEKRFKWFFTFYKYYEIYPKYNPLKGISIDSFLTKNEIMLYTSDNPKFSPELNGIEIRDLLNTIEERKEAWLNVSFFWEYYRITQKNFPSTKGIPVDTILEAFKDSIFKNDFKREPRYFMCCMDNYFKTGEFSALSDSSSAMMELKIFKENFEKPFSEFLNYNLIMPGKLVETNAKQTHGDTLSWKVDAYRFFFNDYEIRAESRVANIWAFIVSGLFILGVALSFFIKRKG